MKSKDVDASAATCIENGFEVSRFDKVNELSLGEILDLLITGGYAAIEIEIGDAFPRFFLPEMLPRGRITHSRSLPTVAP